MTVRGDHTRSALIRATTAVVAQLGYHQATTRAIAAEAGVSEATIYRHFPDKRALFFAAVLDGHQEMLAWIADLPSRAGTGSLADNLTECLTRLSSLRHALIPLELALITDTSQQQPGDAPPATLMDAMEGPPRLLAEYLAGEQEAGRVKKDKDPAHIAVVLLATLFGLAAAPDPSERMPNAIAQAVALVLDGVAVPGSP